MIIKDGRPWEIHEVSKCMWSFFSLDYAFQVSADWQSRQTHNMESYTDIPLSCLGDKQMIDVIKV